MSKLRPEDEPERIPVAARRAQPQPDRPSRRRDSASASGAGWTLIAVIVTFAAAGAWLGNLAQVPVAGALIGGFVGTLVGVTATYWRFRDL